MKLRAGGRGVAARRPAPAAQRTWVPPLPPSVLPTLMTLPCAVCEPRLLLRRSSGAQSAPRPGPQRADWGLWRGTKLYGRRQVMGRAFEGCSATQKRAPNTPRAAHPKLFGPRR